MTARLRRLGAAASALVAALLVAPLGAGPAAARTAPGTATPAAVVTGAARDVPERSSRVSVTLDDLAPAVARPGQDLTLHATVRRTGDLSGPVTVRVLSSAQPFTGRTALDAWVHGRDARPATGSVLAEQAVDADLGSPHGAAVTLTLPASRLHHDSAFGAYPLVVEVRDGQGRAGQLRTLLPWVGSSDEYEPLRLAWVAPLTLPDDPALTAGTEAQVGGAWSRALSGLESRLDAASGVPVTWMVDPAVAAPPTRPGGLVTSPTGPADGAATPAAGASTTGTASAGTGLAAATRESSRLVARLRGLDDDQPLWALPTDDPDAAALVDAGAPDDVRTVARPSGTNPLEAALGRTLPSPAAWPADGRWPTERTSAWSSLTGGQPPTTALVSTASLPEGRGTTPVAAQRTSDGLPLMAYDEDLSQLTGGTATGSDAQLVQDFLGQSLTLLGERPGTRRTALVVVPRGTTMSAGALRRLWSATSGAPWLRTATASDVLTDATGSSTSSRTPTGPASPLTGDGIGQVRSDAGTVHALAGVMPEGTVAGGSWSRGLRDLLSARWRGQGAAWARLHAAVSSSLASARQGVQVRPGTINFLADTGTIQITVTNSLPYAVHDVHLRLVPGSPKLRVDRQPGPLSIGAGSRTTTQVRVTALGAGTVPLQARLSGPGGTDLGSTTTVDMNVRPTSVWVFALVAGIVALVLVLGLARSLRRGPTRAQRELGDHHAVADAVLGPDSTPKDSR